MFFNRGHRLKITNTYDKKQWIFIEIKLKSYWRTCVINYLIMHIEIHNIMKP